MDSNWKGEKHLSLFADNKILSVREPKNSIKRLLGLKSEFAKVTGIKSTPKSEQSFYAETTLWLKKEFNSIHNNCKKMFKYLGANLTKDVRVSTMKIHKKYIEDTQNLPYSHYW